MGVDNVCGDALGGDNTLLLSFGCDGSVGDDALGVIIPCCCHLVVMEVWVMMHWGMIMFRPLSIFQAVPSVLIQCHLLQHQTVYVSHNNIGEVAF